MAAQTLNSLRAVLLLVSLIDVQGAALPPAYQPQHISSNYRHSRFASTSTDSGDFHLMSLLIPKQDLKSVHKKTQESQVVTTRSRRSSQTTGSSNRHRHQPKTHQKAYDKLKAQNFTDDYATIYLQDDLLPRYECPSGQWACPRPDKGQHVLCINESQVCDYHVDCSKALDEDPLFCASYRESRELKAANAALQKMVEELTRRLDEESKNIAYNSCRVGNLKMQLLTHSHRTSDQVHLASPPACHNEL